jgi:hypothetical protein
MAKHSLLSRITFILGLLVISGMLMIPHPVLAESETTSAVAVESVSTRTFTVMGVIALLMIVGMIGLLLINRRFNKLSQKQTENNENNSQFHRQTEAELTGTEEVSSFNLSSQEKHPETKEIASPAVSVPNFTKSGSSATAKDTNVPRNSTVESVKKATLESGPKTVASDTPDIIASYSFSTNFHHGVDGPDDEQNSGTVLLVVNLAVENLKSEIFRFYPRLNLKLLSGDSVYSPIFNGEVKDVFWGEVEVPVGSKVEGHIIFAIPGAAIARQPELQFITSQSFNIKLSRLENRLRPENGVDLPKPSALV